VQQLDRVDMQAKLRTHLQARLPGYMVPSAFVVLEQLPLTPNGKLDRGHLPIPDLGRGAGEDGYVAPATPVEQMLGQIWCDVLGVARVGRDDDFFLLGGHSLLATQVISRVREMCGIELPVRDLFEAPTLQSLADRLAQHSAGPERGSIREAQLLAKIDELSDEEVDQLLRDLAADEATNR
jgi:acyl carrier protein